LHRQSPGLKESEKESCRQDCDRVESREERHRHRIEPKPLRESLDQTIMNAQHFNGTGDPRQRTRTQDSIFTCTAKPRKLRSK
jgi:hypothetical protein